ncbi:hypothetical protein MEQU1_002583 [Malassezia equina]|uniref:J domain-containing protein n=1 Tax=Malassezia equina TaxID=1381935 RepID=A0AAF0IZD9_9BASI|nr:hypothetical protein MEQU1_002583 [Malassezia equina]
MNAKPERVRENLDPHDRGDNDDLANSFSWDYVKTVFEAFAERERALEYRIESLYFHAEKSLRALENPESGTQDSQNALHDANPILGIRLLQRLDQLQKENDDLSRRIEDLIDSTSMETIQSEQLMYMQNEELNNTSDVEEDVKPIFYPDFSSVTQCFGVGTEIEDSHSDLDEYDQRLIEATAVWESSLSQNSGEMSGGLSLPSSLFHLTGQDTEDVMLKSVEYAESLQTATPSVCVSPTASAAEIKSQFYTIAKKLHPDKLDPNLTKKEKEEHLERFRLVVKAYELLKDRRQREMYDKYRMGWEGTTDMPPRTQWSSPSQFRPSTQAEWEQWYMWSEMLRRHGRKPENKIKFHC